MYKGIATLIAIVLIVSMTHGWMIHPGWVQHTPSPLRWINFSSPILEHLFFTNSFYSRELSIFMMVSTVSWVGTLISILGIAVFLLFLCVGSRGTGIIGQLSTLIAFVISTIFVVYLQFVVRGEGFTMIGTNGQGITTSFVGVVPSVWAYITIIVGLIGLVFISIFKNYLNTK